MTPEERAAALIGRIGVTTGTDELARMIADEIRAALAEAREGEAFGDEPDEAGGGGPPPGAFAVARHDSLAYLGEDTPYMRSLELCCYVCGADEPEPGKATLYLTGEGYYCGSCVYDEYLAATEHHLALFPVQYRTLNDVRKSLWVELEGCDEEPSHELVDGLAREIANGMKENEYLKPLPDLVSMLMRGVYYRALHRHARELPTGYVPSPVDRDW